MSGDDGPGRVLAPPPRAPLRPLAEPPSFSVIVRAYQAAGTVAEALRSALVQTHPAHEIIVVDDGSTDDLDGALRPFASAITLVRQANRGAAAAFNAGTAAATGEFVVVLDADDAYHPDRLRALAGLAVARPDLDLLTTDTRFVVGGRVVGRFGEHTPFAVEDQRTAIFRSCFLGGWPAIRRDRLRAVGGLDEGLRVAFDWDCWLRLILDGAMAGLVDLPYYDYHLHEQGLTGDSVLSLWERVRLLEKAERSPALRAQERRALATALRHHRTRAALTEARAAVAGRPDRARLLRLAAAPRLGPRARAEVALGALAPGVARRIVPAYRPPDARFGSDA